MMYVISAWLAPTLAYLELAQPFARSGKKTSNSVIHQPYLLALNRTFSIREFYEGTRK